MQLPIERQQAVASLVGLSCAVDETFAAAPPEREYALGVALSCQCVLCGIVINGSELREIHKIDIDSAAEGKLKRLRMGYCARKGCNSKSYRVVFQRHPDLDWATFLPQVDQRAAPVEVKEAEELGVMELVKKVRPSSASKNAWMLVGVVVLIFMIRQWYVGGSIPVIRPAEKFKVEPWTNAPAAEFED